MKFDDIKEVKHKNNKYSKLIIISVCVIVGILIIVLISSLLSGGGEVETNPITANSRIARSLYKKVHPFNNDPFWMYEDEDTKIIADMKETTKMTIVYNNLRKSDFKEISCSRIPKDEVYEDYTCSGTTLMVEKDVVDETYRDLFGSNSISASALLMKVDREKNEAYIYIEDLDGYVRYVKEKPTAKETRRVYNYEFIKTIVIEDKLLLYEVVTEKDLTSKKVSKSRYVYTFRLDNDGLYNYYSFEEDDV